MKEPKIGFFAALAVSSIFAAARAAAANIPDFEAQKCTELSLEISEQVVKICADGKPMKGLRIAAYFEENSEKLTKEALECAKLFVARFVKKEAMREFLLTALNNIRL